MMPTKEAVLLSSLLFPLIGTPILSADGACFDERKYRYNGRKKRKCRRWVAKKPAQRCDLVDGEGVRVGDVCRVSCGTCGNPCVDDGGFSSRCEWVASDPGHRCEVRHRRRGRLKSYCPRTCGLCHGDGDDDGDRGESDNGGGGGGGRLADISELTYEGAFRLRNGDFGASSVDYAVGALAYNPARRSLYIAGHAHHKAVAEYAIVDVPSKTATDAGDLPETGPPLQDFARVLDLVGTDPGGPDRITGMLWIDGSLVVNAERWYDGGGQNKDTTMVIRDASSLGSAGGGNADGFYRLSGAANSAGYMGRIPPDRRADFGYEYYTGWSSVYSITSRYSQGPSLWGFDPRNDIISGSSQTNPNIEATPFVNYAYDGPHLSDRAVENAPQGTPGPFPPASKLWNSLSRGMYGFFVPGGGEGGGATRTFAVIGSTGGIETGIGYKAVQENGHVCGGPCPFGVNDTYNYFWLYEIDDILSAEHVYDPKPYMYGVWSLPFDDGGSHSIIGATLDDEGRFLYVAIANAGRVGIFDRPPLILVYSLP